MPEHAVYLGSNREVFGIHHEPSPSPTHRSGFVFLNAGLIHRPGPFRLHTDLARALGERGIPSLRIDQCGKGDSPRRLGQSAMESAKLDYKAAAGFFGKKGVDKLIIVGLCSGADDALWISQGDPSVFGIVMFDGYATRTARFRRVALLRKLRRFTPKKLVAKIKQRLGPKSEGPAEESLEDLRNFPTEPEGVNLFKKFISRRQKGLFFYTGDISYYYNHSGQLEDAVKDPHFSNSITEVYLPHAKHTYPFVSDRLKLIDDVCAWAVSIIDETNQSASPNNETQQSLQTCDS